MIEFNGKSGFISAPGKESQQGLATSCQVYNHSLELLHGIRHLSKEEFEIN